LDEECSQASPYSGVFVSTTEQKANKEYYKVKQITVPSTRSKRSRLIFQYVFSFESPTFLTLPQIEFMSKSVRRNRT
jgi:hypothetical protein